MNGRTTFDEKFYVRCYQYSQAGLSRGEIATALGVKRSTFKKWYAEKPALRDAVVQGRAKTGKHLGGPVEGGETYIDFVYKLLPKDLQVVWDELAAVFDSGTPTQSKIECVLAGQDEKVRQHLFLHALVYCNFSASAACRRVNITLEELGKWKKQKGFHALFEQVTGQIKKDYCEAILLSQARTDPATARFVNKTLNRDRGYDPSLTVRHEGLVGHVHQGLEIQDVLKHLSVDAQREVLGVLRALQKGEEPKPPPKEVKALPEPEVGDAA